VRSKAAAAAAARAGYAKVYNVVEGFEGALDAEQHRGAAGWKAAGLPWRQS
jgi:rhodanese-related sulfurtransferase